jgi:hypothetical protein
VTATWSETDERRFAKVRIGVEEGPG